MINFTDDELDLILDCLDACYKICIKVKADIKAERIIAIIKKIESH